MVDDSMVEQIICSSLKAYTRSETIGIYSVDKYVHQLFAEHYQHQKWQRIRPNTKWIKWRWIKWCQASSSFRTLSTSIKNGSAFVRILNGLNGAGLNGAIKWCQASSSFRTLRKKFCKMQKKIAIFAQSNRYFVQPSVIIRNYFLLFHSLPY